MGPRTKWPWRREGGSAWSLQHGNTHHLRVAKTTFEAQPGIWWQPVFWKNLHSSSFFCAGKSSDLPHYVSFSYVFLSCVSPLLLTQNAPHWRFWPLSVCFFSPAPSNSAQHQLGVLQFTSIPTLSTWRQCQVPWDCPHFRCQSQIVKSPGYPQLCLTWLQVRSSHNLPLSPPRASPHPGDLINSFERLTDLRETLTYLYQFIRGYDKGYR